MAAQLVSLTEVVNPQGGRMADWSTATEVCVCVCVCVCVFSRLELGSAYLIDTKWWPRMIGYFTSIAGSPASIAQKEEANALPFWMTIQNVLESWDNNLRCFKWYPSVQGVLHWKCQSSATWPTCTYISHCDAAISHWHTKMTPAFSSFCSFSSHAAPSSVETNQSSVAVHVCSSQPCGVHGTCVEAPPAGYTCLCAEGHTGDRCQTGELEVVLMNSDGTVTHGFSFETRCHKPQRLVVR